MKSVFDRNDGLTCRNKTSVGFLLHVVAVLVGIYLVRNGSLDQLAPAFSLPGIDGGRIDLESDRGRPALPVFWARSESLQIAKSILDYAHPRIFGFQ